MNQKDESEKRRNRVNLRVTDEELSTIRILADRLEMTYTALLVKAVDSLRRRMDGRKGEQ